MLKIATRILVCCSLVVAFSPRCQLQRCRPGTNFKASADQNPLEEFSDERKAELFQFLLRDLQVEGVPLLAVDADPQIHILQAAVWTTCAELCEQPDGQKACMVFEQFPVDALRNLVDDFMVMKNQDRLMQFLPELGRLSLSLVGRGVGPAILIETGNATEASLAQTMSIEDAQMSEFRNTAAMKSFLERMSYTDPYPYNQQASGFPISYKSSPLGDTCHILSSFWNCICEMIATPEDELGSMVLTMPSTLSQMSEEEGRATVERFSAVSEVLSRSLCLFRGDDVFELYHFHPKYDRNAIFPDDKPAPGHIPPKSWLQPMLRKSGSEASLTKSDLEAFDYQRRSPVPAVLIKRVSLFAEAQEGDGVVELDLADGTQDYASSVEFYTKSTIALAEKGPELLQKELDADLSILS